MTAVRTTGLTAVTYSEMASSLADVRWHAQAGPETLTVPQPLVLGGASDRARLDAYFAGRSLTTSESGCLVCRNAAAYDCGLVLKDDRILLDQLLTVEPSQLGAWGFFKNVEGRNDGTYDLVDPVPHPRRLKRAVLVLKRSDFVHGHWLLESLPKAYLALTMMGDGEPASFIVSANSPRYQIEMLEALGIPSDAIVRLAHDEILECEELWIPSLSHTNQLWLHPSANAAYDALVQAVARADAGPGPADIFVTRASRSNDPRSLYNIEAIEAVAVAHGFSVVDPGVVPWREQVRLFANARRIVGLCGSGLHNTLFAGPDVHVCTLQQNQNNNYMQSSIAALRNHDVSYLVGETLAAFDGATWHAGFVIDPVLFDDFLGRMTSGRVDGHRAIG